MNKRTNLKNMLELREKCYQYYIAYEKYARWLFRFFVALLVFSVVAAQFGYEDKFKNPVIVLGLSVLAGFVTDRVRVFMVFLFTVVQIYFLSPILAGIVFLFGGFLFLLLARYDYDTILAVVLLPVFLWCKVPFFVVIIMGLFFTPVSILSAASGVIMYYVLHSVKLCEEVAKEKNADVFSLLKKVMDAILYNKEMYIMLFTMCAVLLVTYVLRICKKNYSFEMGIVFGTVCSIVLLLMGNIFLECKFSMVLVFAGSLLSGLIAFVVHFFHMVLDYGTVEEVQFEDDDYYYYVKAVPKMKMTVGEKKVQHIYAIGHSAGKELHAKEDMTTEQKEKGAAVVKRAEHPRSMRNVSNTDQKKESATETKASEQKAQNAGNRRNTQHSSNTKKRKKTKRKR